MLFQGQFMGRYPRTVLVGDRWPQSLGREDPTPGISFVASLQSFVAPPAAGAITPPQVKTPPSSSSPGPAPSGLPSPMGMPPPSSPSQPPATWKLPPRLIVATHLVAGGLEAAGDLGQRPGPASLWVPPMVWTLLSSSPAPAVVAITPPASSPLPGRCRRSTRTVRTRASPRQSQQIDPDDAQSQDGQDRPPPMHGYEEEAMAARLDPD